MTSIISLQILVLTLFVVVTITNAFPQATERPAVSDEQLESTLKDKRYLLRQLKCALGEAPCDPVGRRIKSKYFKKLLLKTRRFFSIRYIQKVGTVSFCSNISTSEYCYTSYPLTDKEAVTVFVLIPWSFVRVLSATVNSKEKSRDWCRVFKNGSRNHF